MIKAIQVLGIHLFELDKVSQFTDVFCQKYKEHLKTEVNLTNLLETNQSQFEQDISNSSDSSNTNSYTSNVLNISDSHSYIPSITPSSHPQTLQIQINQLNSFQYSTDYCCNSIRCNQNKVNGNKEKNLPKNRLSKDAIKIMRSWFFQNIGVS